MRSISARKISRRVCLRLPRPSASPNVSCMDASSFRTNSVSHLWCVVQRFLNRWAKSGVLDRMFAQLQTCQIVRIKIEAVSLDSTSIKVHPDGTGALKKTAHNPSGNRAADGTPKFIWLPQMLEQPSRSD
ncbi:hypothetical protein BCR61_12765 [Xanthomonas oryzae pv. oryzae]|nr:hypothetical protein BCR61_12765 [Xanthomonas oryzae pv. oryzae]AXQ77399.1 hypothetical protein BXU03_12575 [Xanthomonas oryzae pv. oryzae]